MKVSSLKWIGALALMAVAASIGIAHAAAPNAMGTERATAKTRPNIVVIETDDQTLDSMRAMTNTLRLLGQEGTTFDNNFVSFSLCCPSRSTFLTGQYAHNHGVLGNSLPAGGYHKLNHANTLPVWLQRAGYYTVEVGKYLNGYGKPDPLEIPPGWNEWHAGVNLAFIGGTMNENGKLVQL
ncbi:MAG: sulfatase-like hydrolase/transferase, partial [Solirubrobacterales bacterium]|nr:sulfatase-like hydrolase/transferase [Solirubrobacterales bacterium]